MTPRDDRPVEVMKCEADEGLPPADPMDITWLFTCCGCGRRWADPPGPVSGCGCGCDQVVGHKFDADRYNELRKHGRITPTAESDRDE